MTHRLRILFGRITLAGCLAIIATTISLTSLYFSRRVVLSLKVVTVHGKRLGGLAYPIPATPISMTNGFEHTMAFVNTGTTDAMVLDARLQARDNTSGAGWSNDAYMDRPRLTLLGPTVVKPDEIQIKTVRVPFAYFGNDVEMSCPFRSFEVELLVRIIDSNGLQHETPVLIATGVQVNEANGATSVHYSEKDEHTQELIH